MSRRQINKLKGKSKEDELQENLKNLNIEENEEEEEEETFTNNNSFAMVIKSNQKRYSFNSKPILK